MAGTPQVVTPYICCKDAARALEFYARAFGAREIVRYTGKGGEIGHAEIEIEGGTIYVSDEWPEGGVFSPQKYGGTPVSLHLLVANVDALAASAVAAGGTMERAPKEEPYGQRAGVVRDPFGHRWFLATAVEEVSREELRRRMGDSYLIE